VITRALVLVHAGVAALWLGAMAYSLFNVQPKLARMVDGDEEKAEDAQRILAHGNRWTVVAMIGVLWASGAALVALRPGNWPVVAVKAALLAAATGIFWWVSWRAWPRRVFALPAELPAVRRRFRVAAVGILALVAAAFALSYLAAR
jgi:Flp pilus assembly protein TadB